jgi:uncharacterized protein
MKNSAAFGVVFDCNVLLLAAAREKSIASECLRLVENGVVQLYVSEDILTELEDVLTRPEVKKYFKTLTDEAVFAFLLKLRKTSSLISKIPRKFRYPRDPDDEPYINLAVASKADYLVSRDRDLLDLMSSHSDEAKEFRQRFRPLQVIEPLEFLKLVRSIPR